MDEDVGTGVDRSERGQHPGGGGSTPERRRRMSARRKQDAVLRLLYRACDVLTHPACSFS